MLDTETRKEFREYLWKYFALHADQRLKTFNFYIVVSAVFISGYLNLISKSDHYSWSCIIPFFLAITSFIFWKLDLRTKRMVKEAERGLKYLDENCGLPELDGFECHPLKIFSCVDHTIKNMKKFSEAPLGENSLSYSNCFITIFCIFGITGAVIGFIDMIHHFV